ncbi:MAG: GNAT family N-acetyltransferase [Acidobacteriia bacterium]|nr:GNAT family N-acetyltransferase [Terriglobia bacterium]
MGKKSIEPRKAPLKALVVRPLTPSRWKDLELLFGQRGACGGCWCMWWRLKRSQFVAQKGEGNRRAFRRIVELGEIPGLLAYLDNEPIGWCALSPREKLPVLERSRILQPVDDQPAWSVVCFFVSKPFRRQGITTELLKAAVDYARKRGARIVEGYPVETRKGRLPDPFVYTGLPSAFKKAGFVEALRRSPTRPIMRYVIDKG